jgi:Ca2+-transporting ATPase
MTTTGTSPKANWHTATATATTAGLDVDPAEGLTSAAVEERRAEFGMNRLADTPRRPRWKVFLDQFRSAIVLILIGAAVLSGLVGRCCSLTPCSGTSRNHERRMPSPPSNACW